MTSLSDRIVAEVSKRPGITDKWLAEALFGAGASQQRVNSECRRLAAAGKLTRRSREDGLIGNFSGQFVIPVSEPPVTPTNSIGTADVFSEDEVKKHIETWLLAQGWTVAVAWAKTRGVDIAASKGPEKWFLEVKGQGSLPAMRVNYFLAMLGELLQRMDDPDAKYSIALPDIPQFRNLWQRLPALAKQRTTITAIFVGRDGSVAEVI